MGSKCLEPALMLMLAAAPVVGQGSLQWKSGGRSAGTDWTAPVAGVAGGLGGAGRHWILEFEVPPAVAQVARVQESGFRVVGMLPLNGLVVFGPDPRATLLPGVRWVGRFEATQKLSPLVNTGPQPVEQWEDVAYLVEAFPDAGMDAVRALIQALGLTLLNHPNLLPNQLLVRGRQEDVLRLSGWDEITYVFPASRDLMEGRPVIGCSGAANSLGWMGQYVARAGEGWEGAGRNPVDLQYHFERFSAALPEEEQKAEITKALLEWSRHAKIRFHLAPDLSAPKSLVFLFAQRSHGCPYTFDGRGGVLAHTYYPAPPNPEPIAGDMHLDEEEVWRIGADVDLYSVVLHELGHALGLAHSDRPGAVMYPYYRRLTTLTKEDIEAIQELYASPDDAPSEPGEPAAPQAALEITVEKPGAGFATAAAVTELRGKVSGAGSGVRVHWASDRAASGTAGLLAQPDGTVVWSVPAVPLLPGRNLFTITASDPQRAKVAVVTLTAYRNDPDPAPSPQEPVSPPSPSRDTTPPTIQISSPPGSTSSTSAAKATMRGRASDNAGVAAVEWASSAGGSGPCFGTASWACQDIPLLVGANVLTVRAKDTAGNTAWRSAVVTRR
jgi:hypothetical protein